MLDLPVSTIIIYHIRLYVPLFAIKFHSVKLIPPQGCKSFLWLEGGGVRENGARWLWGHRCRPAQQNAEWYGNSNRNQKNYSYCQNIVHQLPTFQNNRIHRKCVFNTIGICLQVYRLKCGRSHV
ncbi:hypothetical protein FR483_n122R [Paramecium bursaria Chlorella virus FR483]|uniref:Uncharacterized protein n122R n=1 Tax=Paramecium bursaria Chlorella virus FR483 TaxID=399781 RepID=A7J6H6_PBCVF|nr:hypothetical protein FR483_n122R [Paramecium bursaria Chlorella virus FR483]ABT15407.1 hypothetical protein FR483_n122R [Paramecium bursaria Chlorella virus FR483]